MSRTSRALDEIGNAEVAAVYNSYPPRIRTRLMVLRRLILETAERIEGLGEIEETLKWGEPSYLTPVSKSGSTIRIDWKGPQENETAIFFKCTANLVPAFRERYPRTFRYSDDRAILFPMDQEVPAEELMKCIALALTYHRNKKLDPESRWELVDSFFSR